jgi:uncharacterized protein (TIGR02996 family)
MTDRQALFRAVLAEPADDLPRLVMADFLDERGEFERAGYIRASVELARLVDADQLDSDGYAAAVATVASVPFESLWGWACEDGLPLFPESVSRTRHTAGALDWVRDVGFGVSIGFRRGFPEAVRCRSEDWMAQLHPAVKAVPLNRVELTDCRPYDFRPREWVYRLGEGVIGGPGNVLPLELFDLLPGRQSSVAVYRTRREAVDALSEACLSFARVRIG